MIAEYEYPDIELGLVSLKEEGMFSSKREYLRISRQRYHYFVCACPFGRSFFISWWFQEDAHTGVNIAERLGTVGRMVAQSMESKTFYQVDTETMFISCVSALIRRAFERVRNDKVRSPCLDFCSARSPLRSSPWALSGSPVTAQKSLPLSQMSYICATKNFDYRRLKYRFKSALLLKNPFFQCNTEH